MLSPSLLGAHCGPGPTASQVSSDVSKNASVIPGSSDRKASPAQQCDKEIEDSILAEDSQMKCPRTAQSNDTPGAVNTIPGGSDGAIEKQSLKAGQVKRFTKPATSLESVVDDTGYSFQAAPSFSRDQFSGPQAKPYVPTVQDERQPKRNISAAQNSGVDFIVSDPQTMGVDETTHLTTEPVAGQPAPVSMKNVVEHLPSDSFTRPRSLSSPKCINKAPEPREEALAPGVSRYFSGYGSSEARNTSQPLSGPGLQPNNTEDHDRHPNFSAGSPLQHTEQCSKAQSIHRDDHLHSIEQQTPSIPETNSRSLEIATTSTKFRNSGASTEHSDRLTRGRVDHSPRGYKPDVQLHHSPGRMRFPQNCQDTPAPPEAAMADLALPSARKMKNVDHDSRRSGHAHQTSRPVCSIKPSSPSAYSAMSKDSNTSRRRDSAVEKSKYRSDSRAEMQKTFAEWTARLEDSERKEKKLSAKLQLQAALMTGKCDTIERKEAEVAAMRERIEVGKRQLIKCGRERDSIATDYDQLHADTQDLQQKYKQVQAEVKEMQCKKAQADEEVQRLKNEIEEHKSRVDEILAAVSSRGQELQRRDEVINGLTAALKGHFDELEAALRTTNTSQVDLRHSMTQVQESIQNQLSTQLEGHCSREADMRQELIEMAEEKTQCATLLDVRYRQLKEVELSHEKKTEEAQGLRLQIASLESTANQEATMADDIAELRQALSNKDAQSTILQQQIQDINVTHQNEIALLKKNMELEISGLQEEANVKTLKICDMENQLRDQTEMRQKDTGDIKERLTSIYESLRQKGEEPLRSVVSDTIDVAIQTECHGTTNSGRDVVFEDTIVVRSDVRKEPDESPGQIPILEQDATAETVRLRRDLVDAEQRIANLTHRLKSPSQSPMDNNALNRLKQTNNELLVAKRQLRILEERAVDVEGMNEQFQTMLAIQRVLHHTHQSCLAETEAAETRMSNTVGPAPARQFDLESVSLAHSKPRGDEQNGFQHNRDNDVSPTAVVVQLREKRIVLRTPSQSEAGEALQKVSNVEERTQRRVMGPTKSILRRRPTTDSKVFEPISGGPFKFTPAIKKSGLPSGLRAYDQPVVGHVRSCDYVAENRAVTRSLQSSVLGRHAIFRESGLLSPIDRQRRELQAPGPSLQAIKGKRPGQFESVTESKKPRVDDDIEDVTEAEEVSRRDGFPADPSKIYLSGGASSGVNTLLNVICAGPKTGVLVPIPQYPLYTASLAVLNATCVPYYLDEAAGWGTDLDTIRTAHAKAKEAGTDVRALVVINPGNPTGASLPEDNIRAILDFAREENLVVLADEVYQTNVFEGRFYSFKQVLRALQSENKDGKFDHQELASLHSVSKGMVGECGHRGGYFELVGFAPEVEAEIYKFVSITLCAPVVGQCMVELMVRPPVAGEPSYELYDREYSRIFNGLRERAVALHKAFADMEGSEEYRAKLAKGDKDLPFDQVISANIGNPQQLDQKPITFFRQVLSLMENPLLLEHKDVLTNQLGYKTDVIERAEWLLSKVGSVGAYSASAGVPAIKESIANNVSP
ncbi:hypothetical protein BN1708_007740 [Verticillium longisporum]|uniref:Glutamate pyruvate transaminase n=1 Tax=Verticillium longisporum TaxID=100787 RepID=A0A0G4MVL2_VERLO|nr:hypothetical protein BN1708_007740 [Verticillium longisporum]